MTHPPQATFVELGILQCRLKRCAVSGDLLGIAPGRSCRSLARRSAGTSWQHASTELEGVWDGAAVGPT
jgi:hypothetical protein